MDPLTGVEAGVASIAAPVPERLSDPVFVGAPKLWVLSSFSEHSW